MRKVRLALLFAAGALFFAFAGAGTVRADVIYNAQLDGGHGNQTGNSTVSVSYGSTVPLPGTLTNIFAQAIAGPNDLGVEGNVSAAGDPTNPGGWVESESTEQARLSDSLLLQNAPSTGTLALYVHVAGDVLLYNAGGTLSPDGGCSLQANCTNFTQAGVELTANAGLSSSCVALYTGPGFNQPAGCGLLADGVDLLQVSYSGNVVPLYVEFDATALCEALYDNYTIFDGSCYSDTDFLDTAQIASIVVEDANGNPVAGATATSMNGVNYTVPSVAPEPTSRLLLLAALGVVGALRLRRRPGSDAALS